VARRTLRTNLRFIGRRVVPRLYPADLPLPRERSRQPYRAAEISGYLALADAQPTRERPMRAAGLVCLGAGTGLIRGGTDPGRRNITNPLITALDGGGGLPRLDADLQRSPSVGSVTTFWSSTRVVRIVRR
jgi:hypothetical protein